MEQLAIASAKSIWLVNLAELNPKGLRLFPNLTNALTDLYDFDEQPDDAPTVPGTSSQPGIKFKNGQFETEQGAVRVSLELYDDGIVADSSVSTEVTNLFIQHAIDWATTAFGLKFSPSLVMNQLYASEVVVKLTSRFSERLKPLSTFADLLSGNSFGAPPQAFFPSGVTFATASGGAPFTIERRANTPLDANVFYSKAAIDTSTHLKLLADFDRMLGERLKPPR